jgi:hypothetical protein
MHTIAERLDRFGAVVSGTCHSIYAANEEYEK